MTNNKIYLKHTGLSIPDLFIEYTIDKEKRIIEIKLGDHFDSALLIGYLSRLEVDENISILDNRADGNIKMPEGEIFALKIELCGLLFEAKIVRLGAWLSKPGSPPKFTFSMQRLEKSDFVKPVQSSVVAPVGGHVFLDLGFPSAEAGALKTESNKIIAQKLKMKKT